MNFRQLEVFRATMDAGTTVGAAKQLSLSQPAVSQHLAQLETELGLVLFVRERGRLVPTQQALALYDDVAYAFEGFERVMNLAQTIRRQDVGVVRIGAPFSMCESLVPRIVARFAETRPNIRFSVELGKYETLIGHVAARQVDLAFLKEPLQHPGVSVCPFLDSDAVCAMPSSHPLAKKERLDFPDLSGEPLIMLGRRKAWRHEIDTIFRKGNLVPNIRLETHSVGAACGFVAAGVGLAVVPELLAAQYVNRGIVLRPFTTSFVHRFVIGFPSTLNTGEMAATFAELARDIAGEIIEAARKS